MVLCHVWVGREWVAELELEWPEFVEPARVLRDVGVVLV